MKSSRPPIRRSFFAINALLRVAVRTPKSGCPPARASRYFPSSPTHYSSLVLRPRHPFFRRFPYHSSSPFASLSFLFSSSFFLILLPLWLTRRPSCSHYISLVPVNNVLLVARGSSVQRPSCIPEPPHCSFLEGKRENISTRRRRDARGEPKVEGSRVEEWRGRKARTVGW